MTTWLQSRKKRNVLSVEENLKILQQTKGGKKKSDVCRESELVNITVHMIWKNGTEFVSAFEDSGSRIKRLRKLE